MKTIIFLTSILFFQTTFAQDKFEDVKKKILDEGFLLYKLRKAETNSIEKIGKPKDYENCVTYFNKDSLVTLFYTKKDSNEADFEINQIVIHDTTLGVKFITQRQLLKKPNQSELELISLKDHHKQSKYPLDFSPEDIGRYVILYKKENYYLIYCMKFDHNENVLPLGGDYCFKKIYSDKYYNLPDLFHRNYIPIDMSSTLTVGAVASMHNHLGSTSNYITPTDICTLLLYKDKNPFKEHLVISRRHISKFNTEDMSLIIMKKKEYNKKYNDNF
jgi:hypothetical protein